MCTGLNFPKVDISFLFTSNREIQKYHQKFLRKKTATDVITFVSQKVPGSFGEKIVHRGGSQRCLAPFGAIDIVISLDQARRQAKPRRLKLFHEVCLLMCHGLLHAKGFDDLNEKDWLTMRQQELQCLAQIL